VVTKKCSFGKNFVEFRDTSLSGHELGSRGIELSRILEITAEGDWKEMARKALGCEKETSCVI
jgi:hypothetical protein